MTKTAQKSNFNCYKVSLITATSKNGLLEKRTSPQSIDLLGLIAIGLDEVTHVTHFGSILIDLFWLISEIGNCGVVLCGGCRELFRALFA